MSRKKSSALITRFLTSVAAIAAVSVIFAAKAFEAEIDREAQATSEIRHAAASH